MPFSLEAVYCGKPACVGWTGCGGAVKELLPAFGMSAWGFIFLGQTRVGLADVYSRIKMLNTSFVVCVLYSSRAECLTVSSSLSFILSQ